MARRGSRAPDGVRRSCAGLRCAGALAVVVIGALGTARDTAAQDTASVRLTLADVQAQALATSHHIAESRARETVAQTVVESRAVADRPMLSGQAGYTRTNHVTEFAVPAAPPSGRLVVYPDVPDNFRTRLDLQWPIYNGGRTDALERAAQAEVAAVTAETDVARADLRLEVARSFWALVTARAAVDVLERGVARARTNVEDVRARLNAGLVPPNELASAEAQESRQRVLLIEARTQRDVTAANLGRLVFDDPFRTIEPVAVLDPGPAAAQNQADALAMARESRGERTVLERRIEATLEQRTAAEAGRRPVVSVGGGVDYAKPNPRIFPRAGFWQDSWDAGVSVTVPIWDGGRVAKDVAVAASQTEVARQRLAAFDSQLTMEVRQRSLEVESGRAAVAAAEDGVRAAAEAQRVVGERYRAGVIAQIEVLDAELALLQAELDRTRAQANVHLAEASLARALGR
jgi:outer membrane protein